MDNRCVKNSADILELMGDSTFTQSFYEDELIRWWRKNQRENLLMLFNNWSKNLLAIPTTRIFWSKDWLRMAMKSWHFKNVHNQNIVDPWWKIDNLGTKWKLIKRKLTVLPLLLFFSFLGMLLGILYSTNFPTRVERHKTQFHSSFQSNWYQSDHITRTGKDMEARYFFQEWKGRTYPWDDLAQCLHTTWSWGKRSVLSSIISCSFMYDEFKVLSIG